MLLVQYGMVGALPYLDRLSRLFLSPNHDSSWYRVITLSSDCLELVRLMYQTKCGIVMGPYQYDTMQDGMNQ